MSVIHFSKLPIHKLADYLTQQAVAPSSLSLSSTASTTAGNTAHLDKKAFRQQWQRLQQLATNESISPSAESVEKLQVDWLIQLFNTVFSAKNVKLVRGESEPEYFPATETAPARIEFAHGFFQSALHEISHWSLAGKHRRTLPDFGYWYAPDGRTEAQQKAFEQVEIKPQAIECLFSLMCGRSFRVSQDNLHADFDTSQSTFEIDVYNQAKLYIDVPQNLPTDAQTLLTVLAFVCHDTIDS
ncbi:elongation factor P hydroxylase [Psychrobacter phenylpyruvicus]|uniref:Protein of uncharacterized function, DUF462 n=1 Tax=Psychrobacter phenylpyruvicus TaxID=29432 RepID=A0A379LN98_9GAMM|nr:elongation factor P hydroxylase [Psychrobacter phenylpyruvicus]SUD91575.1 Protein of uncharacterised function, DUF462 [Psychrobacter phenylpyruvicus]